MKNLLELQPELRAKTIKCLDSLIKRLKLEKETYTFLFLKGEESLSRSYIFPEEIVKFTNDLLESTSDMFSDDEQLVISLEDINWWRAKESRKTQLLEIASSEKKSRTSRVECFTQVKLLDTRNQLVAEKTFSSVDWRNDFENFALNLTEYVDKQCLVYISRNNFETHVSCNLMQFFGEPEYWLSSTSSLKETN